MSQVAMVLLGVAATAAVTVVAFFFREISRLSVAIARLTQAVEGTGRVCTERHKEVNRRLDNLEHVQH